MIRKTILLMALALITDNSFSQDQAIPYYSFKDSTVCEAFCFFSYWGFGDTIQGQKHGRWYLINDPSVAGGKDIINITVAEFRTGKKERAWITYKVNYKNVLKDTSVLQLRITREEVLMEKWKQEADIVAIHTYDNDTIRSAFVRIEGKDSKINGYEDRFAERNKWSIFRAYLILKYDGSGRLITREFRDYNGNTYFLKNE